MNAPADDRVEYERPQTRGDCLPGGINAARPCPWVSCRYHLALHISPTSGEVTLSLPAVAEGDLGGLSQTCALDVADEGPQILEVVAGYIQGLTRERIRQIEVKALRRFRRAIPHQAPDLTPDHLPIPAQKGTTERARQTLVSAALAWARTQKEPWRTRVMAKALNLRSIPANNLAALLYWAGRLTRAQGPDGRWTYSIPTPTKQEAA